MKKQTPAESISSTKKKLAEATKPLVRDLIQALKNAKQPTGHFNFNDYLGRKNADNYDGAGSEIYYWHLTVKGVKWTFSVSEEVDANNIGSELQKENYPEDFLNDSIEDSHDIIDANGVISEPGWLSEQRIWNRIWE